MSQNTQNDNRSNITTGYVPSFDLNEDGFYEEKEIYYPNNKFVDMPEPETPVKRRSGRAKREAKSARKREQKHAAKSAKAAAKSKKGEGRRYKKEKKKTGVVYKLLLALSILIIIIPVGSYFLGCMYLDKLEKESPNQTLIEQEASTQKEISEKQKEKETTLTLSEETEKRAQKEVEKYEKKKAEEERQALYEKESAESDYIYYVELTDGTVLDTKSETEYNDLIAEHRKEGDLSYYHWMWDYDNNHYTRDDENNDTEQNEDNSNVNNDNNENDNDFDI